MMPQTNERIPSEYLMGMEAAAAIVRAELLRLAGNVRSSDGDDDLSAHGCFILSNLLTAIRTAISSHEEKVPVDFEPDEGCGG